MIHLCIPGDFPDVMFPTKQMARARGGTENIVSLFEWEGVSNSELHNGGTVDLIKARSPTSQVPSVPLS